MTNLKKVIIVDDHQIVIEGLKLIFNEFYDLRIEENFNNGKDLLEYEMLKSIDLIFLDVFLPDYNGIDLCLRIKKLYPKIKIIAISSQAERGIVMQLIKNGADGYLLKSASLDDYKYAVKMVFDDRTVFCSEVQKIVTKVSLYDITKIPSITKREKEILILLKKGKSTQEISNELFLSYLTVQTHRRNLLNKFNASNIIELMNILSEYGIIL